MYLILTCSGCGRLFVAKAGVKSRKCAYCGVRVKLAKARRVGSTKTAREAAELVQHLKLSHKEKLRLNNGNKTI